MKKLASLSFFLICIVLASCGSSVKERRARMEADYQETNSLVNKMNALMDRPGGVFTKEEISELENDAASLSFSFYENDIEDAQVLERYSQLQQRVTETRDRAEHFLDDGSHWVMITQKNVDGKLQETDTVYPVYAKRGEVLYIDAETDQQVSIRLYNGDSRTLLHNMRKVTSVHDSLVVAFSAVYLVEVEPTVPTYVNLQIKSKTNDKESIESPVKIKTETETVAKGAARARAITGVEMKSLFEEPRKFTLRGQLKAAFSGSYRALVALQVPKGATDILYSLRISTNETPANSDGKFKQNMDLSYHKIRILGLPLYESSRSIGLLSTILGDNVPPREEDAYINMYVFMSAMEARKFQNGIDVNQLKYHLDYSTVGTQSCNGRIPAAGRNTIYLGFENERVRFNNYVWLEALSVVPTTEYVREKYLIEDSDTGDE